MSEWLIALISSSALAVMLTWAFQWGKRGGNVNARLKEIEKRANNPQILPECSVIFTEIRGSLSELGIKVANLDGKMDTVLLVMRENQKNDEKKHTIEREAGK